MIAELVNNVYGLKELQGAEANTPEIVNFFKEIGQAWVKTDETAWCAAFVNAMLKRAGFPYTGKLNARSFLEIGEQVSTPRPLGSSNEFVDLVVLWRGDPNGWQGHVGFFIAERDGLIYITGGNQSNMVQTKPYPRSRLLEYRRVKKETI